MKYLRGFLMAWGMFCWIPCPYKKWREEDRKAMVTMLPLLGACMGAILGLCWWLLSLIGAGQFASGALLTGAYFLMTGFIHLDGFMDCSDAILPRHAEMETRVRILKDSHSGAFAVICVCLMFMIFMGSMVEIVPYFSIENVALLLMVFTISRFASAVSVLKYKPMRTSQYAETLDEGKEGNGSTEEQDGEINKGGVKQCIPTAILFALILHAEYGALILLGTARNFYESHVILLGWIVLIAAIITCKIDRKMLGGMNGDISGHMITLSEMFGLAAMALMLSV